jgi:ParB family chromosome partitioning protein
MQPGAAGGPLSFSGDEVLRLDLDLIDENPHQTRRTFREDTLRELGESIRVQGVLQPIVVRESGEGRYKLILGERRIRASRLAGIETIPAIVKRVNEQQAAEMTLVENLQRQDLDCVEQAEAFAKLSREFHLTQEQIGARVGLSREAVSNYMRLLSLPEGVVGALIGGRLTFSHARVLLQLKTKDPVSIWYYAKKAIDHGMTVKRFEDFVAGKFSLPDERPPGDTKHDMGGGARWVDPNVKAAQRSLEEVLGMRVRIRDRAGRGKIVIEYATIDDFQRVVGMLRGE